MTGEWALEFLAFDSLENRDWIVPTHLPIVGLEFHERERALLSARAMWEQLTAATARGHDQLLYPRSPSLVWRQHLLLPRVSQPPPGAYSDTEPSPDGRKHGGGES